MFLIKTTYIQNNGKLLGCCPKYMNCLKSNQIFYRVTCFDSINQKSRYTIISVKPFLGVMKINKNS